MVLSIECYGIECYGIEYYGIKSYGIGLSVLLGICATRFGGSSEEPTRYEANT